MIGPLHHTRQAALGRAGLILTLLALTLASLAGETPAARAAVPESHGRLGVVTWAASGTNTAGFHLVVGFRRSYYSPLPNVGDNFDVGGEGALNYGDGNASDSTYHVVSVDVTNDWFLATKDVTHTYSGPGPWIAYIQGCCRLSTPQHINNADESFHYETIVNFATATGNATTSLPPIVDCPLNSQCQFQIVAVAPGSQHLHYRFATAAEAGDSSFVQPGPPYATNAAAISAAGLYSWNTSGAMLNTTGQGDTFYSTQIMIESLNASNTVVTKTPVDFFIRLTTSTNRPPVFTAPTRPDGTAFTIGVQVGNYLGLPIVAQDPDPGDQVTLAVINAPSGSHFTPPTPAQQVHATFTWTPTPAQIGQYVLNFTATDQHGAAALISVSINVVAGCVPYFIDVASGPNPPQDYFFVPVQYLFCHQVVSGYLEPDQTFTYRPYNDTTRGQFAKMIARAYHLAAYNPPTPTFVDVPPANPFYAYIESAYHAGLISGYADNTFRWNAAITRGQLCKLIVGAAGWAINTSGGPHFTDVPATNPFYNFVETAFNHGVISGYADNTFRVGHNATRGQIAKILWQALGSPAPGKPAP